MPPKSIWQYKKAHMVGIKGVGMTALAEILLKNGVVLTGSDVKDEFMTDAVLLGLGVAVADFDARNINGTGAVIRSNAYGPDNSEVKAAHDRGLPLFSYPEVVAELFNAHYGVAVAGSHGKTTTTAMLAHILKFAGKNVTAIVGSKALNWGTSALAGDLSDARAPFVLEADEYKEAFLNYHPHGAIIANIDYDHPDYFKSSQEYENAFAKFIALVPAGGFLVINGDDDVLYKIASHAVCKVIAVSVKTAESFPLQFPGAHYLFDANLAYQAALQLGVDGSVARAALADFKGTARRMELVGQRNGMLVFDDYAHHPTEIRATLAALKGKYPAKKIIAIFQPHTYSRTKALFDDFGNAFSDADRVVFADVYPSARETKEHAAGVDIEKMALIAREGGTDAVCVKNKDDIPDYLKKILADEKNAVVVTLGAGDVWQVARELIR
ncbi:UDP-N-acetylmuramate--L-alanine ligase [Candidatus Azambacteria bacterium]|nr:UDP-N-acetylmuramate--L-alanine ligase [Candidatus Azambacteria bacterium]